MNKAINELKKLGAEVEEVDGGLKLIGNWRDEYNDYHELFVEITGSLYAGFVGTQRKHFLCGLTSLGSLYTNHATPHKNFLRGLTSLGCLYTDFVSQHPDFLVILTSLGRLNTYNITQHPDFLKDIT